MRRREPRRSHPGCALLEPVRSGRYSLDPRRLERRPAQGGARPRTDGHHGLRRAPDRRAAARRTAGPPSSRSGSLHERPERQRNGARRRTCGRRRAADGRLAAGRGRRSDGDAADGNRKAVSRFSAGDHRRRDRWLRFDGQRAARGRRRARAFLDERRSRARRAISLSRETVRRGATRSGVAASHGHRSFSSVTPRRRRGRRVAEPVQEVRKEIKEQRARARSSSATIRSSICSS